MKKYVSAHTVTDDCSFHYLWDGRNYTDDTLRSVLYAPWWTKVNDDEELVLLMDYDGFVEWYESGEEEWTTDNRSGMTADEYLRKNLGTIISVVKEC